MVLEAQEKNKIDNQDFAIVMMSCDKYKCLTPAFNHCLDKYYPNHPKVYYVYGDGCWTKRLREFLKSNVQEDYILFLLDDMILRKPANENLILNSLDILKNNQDIAKINYEYNYGKTKPYDNNWLEQEQNQYYIYSTQPSMWKKSILLNTLTKDEDPWQWECKPIKDQWRYLINNNQDIFYIGYKNCCNFAISRGSINNEFKKFLFDEGVYTKEIKENFSSKLSIITPYYNCLEKTKELANILQPQLTKETEWIIIDDGCNEKELDKLNAVVIHLPHNSGCAGIPRNYGLDIANGEYIAFIDADDVVKNNFVPTILHKISQEQFDICDIGWEAPYSHWYFKGNEKPEWNCSVWSTIFKKKYIGNHRFNDKKIAEDYDFRKEVITKSGVKTFLPDILYTYEYNPNKKSLTQKGVAK